MYLDALKYPIGNFVVPLNITPEMKRLWIAEIASFPDRLQNEVSALNDVQLDTSYRPGGWSLRQVVHHCADSHMNSFIRFKLALTEENPVIKPYFEDRWAELQDSKIMDVNLSISILKGLHARWVCLLTGMNEYDFMKIFIHPEQDRKITLAETTGLYAWHGNHHLGHISMLKHKMGWI